MSYEIDSDAKYKKAGKSVKRVRFSDEVESVHVYRVDDDDGSSPKAETKSATVIHIAEISDEHDELLADETVKSNDETPSDEITDDYNASSIINSGPIAYDFQSFNSRHTNESFPLIPSFTAQNDVNNVSTDELSESCSPDKDEYNFETHDLNELINETRLLTISSVKSSSNDFLSQAEDSHLLSSPESSTEKNDSEGSLSHIVQKNGTSTLSRKRSLEGILVEKQTSKLNSCLRKNTTEFNSAGELKTVVYNAWTKIKNESTPIQNNSCVPDLKQNNEASQKSTSNKTYDTWKRAKRKSKKISHKISDPVVYPKPKSKEDIEESKMAFRAWKKKKDEILKHQMAEKYRKEEKERLDSLMNERIRKNDAESAFSAWNAHKALTLKLEQKKNQWFLQKEKEKLQLKMKKNEEASKIYYEWLRSKVYSPNDNSYRVFDDRPPWTPPGRSNNFV